PLAVDASVCHENASACDRPDSSVALLRQLRSNPGSYSAEPALAPAAPPIGSCAYALPVQSRGRSLSGGPVATLEHRSRSSCLTFANTLLDLQSFLPPVQGDRRILTGSFSSVYPLQKNDGHT